MPLACIIDGKILCVHSGIGKTLKNIDELNRLQRPVEVK